MSFGALPLFTPTPEAPSPSGFPDDDPQAPPLPETPPLAPAADHSPPADPQFEPADGTVPPAGLTPGRAPENPPPAGLTFDPAPADRPHEPRPGPDPEELPASGPEIPELPRRGRPLLDSVLAYPPSSWVSFGDAPVSPSPGGIPYDPYDPYDPYGTEPFSAGFPVGGSDFGIPETPDQLAEPAGGGVVLAAPPMVDPFADQQTLEFPAISVGVAEPAAPMVEAVPSAEWAAPTTSAPAEPAALAPAEPAALITAEPIVLGAAEAAEAATAEFAALPVEVEAEKAEKRDVVSVATFVLAAVAILFFPVGAVAVACGFVARHRSEHLGAAAINVAAACTVFGVVLHALS
jgi:hypothetical protein